MLPFKFKKVFMFEFSGIMILALFQFSPGNVEIRGASQEKGKSEKEEKSEDKRKKVYTNEDLKELKGPEPNQGVTVEKKPSSTHKGQGGSTIDQYRDLQGHDRTYWQRRISPLRNQLEAINSQIAELQQRKDNLNPTSGIKVSRRGRLRASSNTRQSMEKRIEEKEGKRSEVMRSIQTVEEEARKAQALPEWLR